MVDKLKEILVHYRPISHLDLDQCSLTELVYYVVQKMNELIDVNNSFTDEMRELIISTRTQLLEIISEAEETIKNDIQSMQVYFNHKFNEKLLENLRLIIDEMNANGNLTQIIEEQLIPDINNKMDNVAKASRKFYRKYCYSPYWGEVNGNIGTTSSRENMQKDVDACSKAGVDGLTLIVHIGHNTNSNTLFIAEDLVELAWGIEQMQLKGIEPNCIKIHKQGISESNVQTIGETSYMTQWKNLMTQIHEALSVFHFPKMVVHNESALFYGINASQTRIDFVNECLQLARGWGYKVGITQMGFEEACYQTNASVQASCDFIGVNHYQAVSTTNQPVSTKEIKRSMVEGVMFQRASYLKKKTGKPVILSESGVQDYWVSLANPALSTWQSYAEGQGYAPSYGETQGRYQCALIEACADNEVIDEIWTWYSLRAGSRCYEQIRQKLGGKY